MLLLSREDIKKVFSIRDAVEADKKAFAYVVIIASSWVAACPPVPINAPIRQSFFASISNATPEEAPVRSVFDGTKVKKGCTVSCVGAYKHHMQEMDPAILPRASKI